MAAPHLLDPAAIETTKASLAADTPAVAIVTPGTFFEDPTYFDSLPRQAKALIIAIQQTGAHPSRPSFCNDQALQALATFNQTKSTNDLEMGIALYAMAFKYMASDDPGCVVYVYNLARALQLKWETFQNPADLDATIEWYRKCVVIADESNPNLAVYICDVAVMLTRRLRGGKEKLRESLYTYEGYSIPRRDSIKPRRIHTHECHFIMEARFGVGDGRYQSGTGSRCVARRKNQPPRALWHNFPQYRTLVPCSFQNHLWQRGLGKGDFLFSKGT